MQKGLCLIDTPGLGKMTRASKRLEGLMNARVINYLLDKSHEVALAIHVLDISTFLEVTRRLEKKGFISIDVEMVQLLAKILDGHPLIAANKIDKADEEEINTNLEEFIRRIERKYSIKESDLIYPVSVKTGEGMGALKRAVHSRLVRKGFRTPFKLH